MRLRLAVLGSVLASLAIAGLPGITAAAPRHNHHLTIAATPDPVIAGEGVLIYGELKGPGSANQPIRLYHQLADSVQGYTLVGTTSTDSAGFYEFTREENVVDTNRSWFVRGPDGSHSRTVHERVIPLVSLNASTTSTDTSRMIVFTGAVTPGHPFERVFLQQQSGSSDDWRTLASTFLDGGSHYTLAYRWPRPGVHDVRVLIRRDARNTTGASDPVSVNIEQAQATGFTINSSAPIAPAGSSVTISGVLDELGTSTPEPNTVVQLLGRAPGQARFVVLADGTTASDGGYQFSQAALTTDMVYVVRTMKVPHTTSRHTAPLRQGVQDVETIQASSTNTAAGQTVTFSGMVMPNKAGHVIYLQKLGRDGDYHTVAVGIVRGDSTYTFGWSSGAPGTFTFRARITSDHLNLGGRSDPVTVTATAPPASTLPPGS